MPLVPTQTVPHLDLPLSGGGRFSLAGQKPAQFWMLVFYRGLHCPKCKTLLQDLNTRLFDFESRGASTVAITTENQTRADSAKSGWGLPRLPIAHGLTIRQARDWGLYISKHIGKTSLNVDEPSFFAEPGLFLIKPDLTLYYASIQTAPWGRPSWHELTGMIDFVVANTYPARGDVSGET